MMLSCKEVVTLMASGQSLTLFQRAKLRMHLALCKHCSCCSRQLRAMKDGFCRLFKEKSAVDKELIDTVKREVLDSLKQREKEQ